MPLRCKEGMRGLVPVVLVSLALVCAPAVSAKNFRPGDLLLCNARTCSIVRDRALLRAFGSFIYTGAQPRQARAPARGAPALQLRFDNGYVAGMIAGSRLDRFYSFGVFCGRFVTGRWYRLPPSAIRGVRQLTAGLRPMRLVGSMPRSC
jgi:hypothetical protein